MKQNQKIFFVCLSFIIGILIYNLFYFSKSNKDSLGFYGNQYLKLTGTIDEVISGTDKTKLLISEIIETKNNQKLKGNLLVQTTLYPTYHYGERVEISCALKAPPTKTYYLPNNIQAICYQPRIKIIGQNEGNFLIAKILKLKSTVNSVITKTLPEPEAGLLAGILIGDKTGLPPEIMTAFNRTGVTHIIAVSGYNITILATIIGSLCLMLMIHRKRAFYVIIAILIFFVILTGASSSVIRAAVMGIIALLGKQLGRKMQTANLLAITVVVMLIENPFILLYDAGFQLSFLATISLIYFSPILAPYFSWLTEKLSLRENFTTTISAIIFTTPLILFQFGRFSLVAPIVNLLVLPLIPLSMLIGFIQVICSLIFAPLGQIIGWFTWLLLHLIIKIVTFFSSLPLASLEISCNLYVMLFLYCLLFLSIIKSPDHEIIKSSTEIMSH